MYNLVKNQRIMIFFFFEGIVNLLKPLSTFELVALNNLREMTEQLWSTRSFGFDQETNTLQLLFHLKSPLQKKIYTEIFKYILHLGVSLSCTKMLLTYLRTQTD